MTKKKQNWGEAARKWFAALKGTKKERSPESRKKQSETLKRTWGEEEACSVGSRASSYRFPR